MWKQPLNAVIGDAGFVARFGREPCCHDTEEDRIRAHLLYVSELLRQSSDTPRRSECATLLEAYAEQGRFPKHSGTPSRRTPIFVDGCNTPCAVAHLMRETGAGELCEAVDACHHHGYIPEMAQPEAPLAPRIEGWASSVGLSAMELAMIQPAYTAQQMRIMSALSMVLVFGGIASFAVSASGLAMLWQSRQKGLPMSISEWILAVLGILQCLLLPVAFAEEYPGLSGKYRTEFPKKWAKTLWGIIEFSRQVFVVYSVVAAVSLPVGLVLLCIVTKSDAPASPTHDLQGLCKVAWIVLAVIGVVCLLVVAYLCLCHKFDVGKKRNKWPGQEQDQHLRVEDDESADSTESSEESDNAGRCC